MAQDTRLTKEEVTQVRKSFLVMALVLLLVTLAGSMVLAKDLSEIKIAWIGKR